MQQSAEDSLSLRLEGDGRLYKSDERLLNNFDGGVTRRASSYSVGLVKPTRYGVEVGIKAFGEKATNAFVTDAATNGASISLSMDLYKNFLGRSSSNSLKQGAFSLKRASLEKESRLKTFEANVRKLYWGLIANNERRKLLTSLTEQSEKQIRDVVKRKRSGAADSGEVARVRSQWASRKSDLLSLDYAKGDIMRTLKELLPSLNESEVSIGSYSVENTIKEVLACTELIKTYKDTPFKNTPYDEIVDLLEKEYLIERKLSKVYSGPSLKLFGEYSTIGRGIGFSNSREDFYDASEPRKSIGLQFSMPLDGKKKATKKSLELLNKNRYQSEMRQNLSKVKAYHSETVRLIDTLRKVLKSQRETNSYLAKSMRVSNRKYRQARISLQELISEKEASLSSRLKEIDSQLTIINTLIDYFGIYSDTPCSFNKPQLSI